jgi:hypothetical protein
MAFSVVFTKPPNAIVIGLYQFLPIPSAFHSPLTQNLATIHCSLPLHKYDVLKLPEYTRI